jgi:hypothetical protein
MARVDLQAQIAQPLTRSAVYLGPYGVSVTATATCRYTVLLSVAKSSGPRLEGLLMLQPSRISPHEWRSLSESARASAQENLFPVTHSRASQTESILGQGLPRSLHLESLRMLVPSTLGQLESLIPALARLSALTEQRFGLQSARDGKQEALGEAVVLAESTAQQEWLIPLTYLTVSQHEALPTLAKEITSRSESLLGRERAMPGRLEHLLPISPQITAVWNSLLSLTQSALIRSELLQVIQQTHETRQELLGGIQGECQVNAEYIYKMTQARAGALEWLSMLKHTAGLRMENARALAQALGAMLEILTTVRQDAEALGELLLGVQRAREAPWEALSESETTLASRSVPHEMLQPLSSAVASACESIVATMVATTLAAEQLIERILSNAIRQEQLLPAEEQSIARMESLIERDSQRLGQSEQLMLVQAESMPSLEQLRELARSVSQRLESLSTVMALTDAKAEALALVQRASQGIAESLSRLTKSSPGAWESLATLTQELTGLHEQLLGLAPSVKTWQDILRYIAADKTAHSEWLIPVLQELGETYENLFPTVIATASALTEHRQGVDQSALLRLELLKRLVGVGVAATRTAVYEILRPVKQKRSGQFEKRGHVRARRSVWQELWGIIETLKASDAERAHAQAKERTSQAQKPQAQADQTRQSQTAQQQRLDP